MWSAVNEECGKRGVWRIRSVENYECGKYGVYLRTRCVENVL